MRGNSIDTKKTSLRDLDFPLIIAVTVLSVIGVLVVHSATANESTNSLVSTTVKQVLGFGAGFVLMILLALVDYHKLLKYSWIFYAAAILALLYLLLFTKAISGAKRWFYIPMFGTIQPSEFAKPALLLFLAFLVHKLGEKISKVWGILLYLALASPILVLVLREPDLSTGIVITAMILTILFLAGIHYRWIIIGLSVFVVVLIFFLIIVYQPEQKILHSLFKTHQVERINGFFFPESNPDVLYQQNNSVMAIGSGGFFGKGLNNSSLESVKSGNFLSEGQCDFIFAIIGEEMGFFGCVAVILLLGFIVFECIRLAASCSDTAGKVIAGTVGTTLAVQSLINIGVATASLPNTGIPLPFVSAGLSSLIGTYLMIGLALNVGIHGRLKRRVFYQ